MPSSSLSSSQDPAVYHSNSTAASRSGVSPHPVHCCGRPVHVRTAASCSGQSLNLLRFPCR